MILIDTRIFKMSSSETSVINNDSDWRVTAIGRSDFLTCKDLNQFIKLSRGINVEIVEDNLLSAKSRSDINDGPEDIIMKSRTYNPSPTEVSLISNGYTLNPIVVEKEKNTNGKILINLSLDISAYSLLRYTCSYDIRNTYRKFNDYQGCLISVDCPDETNNGPIEFLYMLVLDINTNMYKKIILTLEPDGTLYKVQMNITTSLTSSEFAICKRVSSKYDNKTLGFKFDIKKPETIPTSVLVYKESDSTKEEITRFISDKFIKGISIPDDKLEDVDFIIDEIYNNLGNTKIKAISEYDLTLPLNVFKRMKILYVFKVTYEDEKINIRCLKSN